MIPDARLTEKGCPDDATLPRRAYYKGRMSSQRGVVGRWIAGFNAGGSRGLADRADIGVIW